MYDPGYPVLYVLPRWILVVACASLVVIRCFFPSQYIQSLEMQVSATQLFSHM